MLLIQGVTWSRWTVSRSPFAREERESGSEAICAIVHNRAWIWGRNEHHQLSFPLPASVAPVVSADAVPAALEPFLLNNLPDSHVPLALKKQGIVEASVGRSHTLLVTDGGEVWSAGWNNLGQVYTLTTSSLLVHTNDLRHCSVANQLPKSMCPPSPRSRDSTTTRKS